MSRKQKDFNDFVVEGFKRTVQEKFPDDATKLYRGMKKKIRELVTDDEVEPYSRLEYLLNTKVYPVIASYLTLRNKMEKAEALDSMDSILNEYSERAAIDLVVAGAGKQGDSLYEILPDMATMMITMSMGRDVGFELQVDKGNVESWEINGWRFTISRCPYHEACERHGCPELCSCFCNADHVCYTNFHAGVDWKRRSTLGAGRSRCRFELCLNTYGAMRERWVQDSMLPVAEEAGVEKQS